jgi:hypothetical protein
MSDGSYYNWKAKYAGLTVSELKRLKALEEDGFIFSSYCDPTIYYLLQRASRERTAPNSNSCGRIASN